MQLSDLYLFLIVALILVGPIAFVLWRKYSPLLVYADPAGPQAADEDAVVELSVQRFQAVPTAKAAPEAAPVAHRPPLKLAPLPYITRALLQDTPHIGIIGNSGSGKTTAGEAIIRLLEGEGYVLDPKWWRGKWGGLPASPIDDNGGYTHISQGMQTLFDEFKRRIVTKRDNPHARFPHLWIIWDEINDTMEEVKEAGVFLRRLLRLGREYNMHVVFFPQSDRVAALGLDGHGDAVKNVLWMYLGEDARTVVKRLVKDGKIDEGIGQQLIALQRPAVMNYAGNPYAVDVSEAPLLGHQSLSTIKGWGVPVPSSETLKTTESTLGTRELGNAEPPVSLSEIQEAAILWWLSQGMGATEITTKLGIRKQDGLARVREVKASLEQKQRENHLQSKPEQAAA